MGFWILVWILPRILIWFLKIFSEASLFSIILWCQYFWFIISHLNIYHAFLALNFWNLWLIFKFEIFCILKWVRNFSWWCLNHGKAVFLIFEIIGFQDGQILIGTLFENWKICFFSILVSFLIFIIQLRRFRLYLKSLHFKLFYLISEDFKLILLFRPQLGDFTRWAAVLPRPSDFRSLIDETYGRIGVWLEIWLLEHTYKLWVIIALLEFEVALHMRYGIWICH